MNKYEIALDEITVQFLAMRNMVKGYSSERDKDLLNTFDEDVMRVTATDDGIDPYVSLSEYKKGRNDFVRLNRCEPYFFEDLREGMDTLSFRTLEAIVNLKQLVDRATPKQVEHFNDECCCAVCGCKLFAARPVDFCPDCGQALDWRNI